MLDKSIITTMLNTGCSAEQIAAVVLADIQQEQEKVLARRASGRQRQRRYIEKLKQNQQSTDGHSPLVTVSDPLPPSPPSLPDKEKVSIPLKEINHPSPLYPPSPVFTGMVKSDFDLFWQAFPHRIGKKAAAKAFASASKRTTLPEMLAGIERYRATKPPDRPWCNPSTWLNQDRWLDEPDNILLFAKPLSPREQRIKNNEEMINATFAAIQSGEITINPFDKDWPAGSGPLGAAVNKDVQQP